MQSNRNTPSDEPIPFSALDKERWHKHIADWEASNESQKNYCERLHLNLNTFTYWRSKLLAEKKKESTNGFIPVKIKNDVNKLMPSEAMTIENSKGIKIHLPITITEAHLVTLLSLLGW